MEVLLATLPGEEGSVLFKHFLIIMSAGLLTSNHGYVTLSSGRTLNVNTDWIINGSASESALLTGLLYVKEGI